MKAYRKFVCRLISFIFLIIVTACSAQPSESDARKVLENGTRGAFKVNSFKKINGQSGELFGTKTYSVEYEAEISSMGEFANASISNLYFFEQHLEKDAREVMGNTVRLKGNLIFIKTENGWKGEDENIY